MKISQFEELTQFVADEYLKMNETYGIQKPSNEFLKFIETTLIKYTKLYDKPLYKLQKYSVKIMKVIEKQELDLEMAFATMPHGWWWKFWHSELWKKMQLREPSLQKQPKEKVKKSKEKKDEKPQVTVPAVIVKKVSSPVPPNDIEVE